MELKQQINLHNEFTIEVHDAITGKLKQTAKAYNLILDQGFAKIITHFSYAVSVHFDQVNYLQIMAPGVDTSSYREYRFGGYIQYGRGTGALSPTRTQLFNRISGRYAEFHAKEWNPQNSIGFHTRKIIINASEHVGEVFTEIGLASHSDATWLSTHAIIEDSEGNPIAITKTDLDVITIYSKVWVTVSMDYPNTAIGEFIERFFINNGVLLQTSLNSPHQRYQVYAGQSAFPVTPMQVANIHQVSSVIFNNNDLGVVYSTANKNIKFNFRFNTNVANSKLWEIAFGVYVKRNESTATSVYSPLFRSVMPISGAWNGKTITGENVGVGDGVNKKFNLKWTEIRPESDTIYINGVPKIRNVDYVIHYKLLSGTNLALKRVYSNNGTINGSPSKLCDGDIVTDVDFRVSDFPQHVQIDAPEAEGNLINKLRIYVKTNPLRAFELQGLDNGSWVTIVDSEVPNTASVWQEFTFTPVSYESYRFVVKSAWNATLQRYVGEVELLVSAPTHTIEFTNAPALNDTITGDYTVDFIPKDENHVLDVKLDLQFGDGNAV